MPRTPRNPGSGKLPHNGPAQGAGSGQWGGPAKGSNGNSRAEPFEPGNAAAAVPDEKTAKLRRFHALEAEEKRRQIHEVYLDVMLHDINGNARANAADKLETRLFGAVPTKNINLNVDDVAQLDDAALAAERQAIERAISEAATGGASEAPAQKPNGLVH